MSGKRPPAPPPSIEGFEYLNLLGSGGFSDVYLYQQDRPRRKVAVKVLLSDLKTESARKRFESEANLMAQLSSHPYIVTIFEADITAEGHSYLAMEYCSRPSLDVRYRRARLGVDEVLSLAIQVASAVETAHRAGIVHRDIKPANILVTDYNRPALTDFGISGTTDALDDEAGLSIPWSPPEAFAGGSPNGVRMDVWSLGATIYTLLAGRSPFVRSGADNSQRELISRITTAPLASLNRPDVPPALEQTLATSMAKSPWARFESVNDLALALQRVQAELGLSVTAFEVMEEPVPRDEPGEDDGGEATRVRQVVSIDPEAGTGRGPTPGTTPPAPTSGVSSPTADLTAADPAAVEDATIMRGRLPDGSLAGSRQRQGAHPGQGPEAGSPGGRTRNPQGSAPGEGPGASGWVPAVAPTLVGRQRDGQRFPTGLVAGLGAVLAMVIAGIFVVNALNRGSDENETSSGVSLSQAPADPLLGQEGVVPQVKDFTAKKAGSKITFSWKSPEAKKGDVFYWAPVTATEQGENRKVEEPTATTEEVNGEPTCIQVVLVRSNGKASDPGRYCSDG
ncbi:serine/threonine protein kinase [Arthrobacter sp. AOP36-C1-22]|uniref:serine/threonine protein kinase n=1 Tax=Arthrobacter sp. AOP36-C1-22 TaxID=3457683 RepID=UPI0040332612